MMLHERLVPVLIVMTCSFVSTIDLQYQVTLNVFSGKDNPKWSVTDSDSLYTDIESALETIVPKDVPLPATLGYRGFEVNFQTTMWSIAKGDNPYLERLLLLPGQHCISPELYSTVMKQIEPTPSRAILIVPFSPFPASTKSHPLSTSSPTLKSRPSTTLPSLPLHTWPKIKPITGRTVPISTTTTAIPITTSKSTTRTTSTSTSTTTTSSSTTTATTHTPRITFTSKTKPTPKVTTSTSKTTTTTPTQTSSTTISTTPPPTTTTSTTTTLSPTTTTSTSTTTATSTTTSTTSSTTPTPTTISTTTTSLPTTLTSTSKTTTITSTTTTPLPTSTSTSTTSTTPTTPPSSTRPSSTTPCVPSTTPEPNDCDCECEAPDYEPDDWNNKGSTRRRNNCYNYATNQQTDTFAQPGRGSCDTFDSLTGDDVKAAAERDGLCDLGNPPIGEFPDTDACLVALVVWPGVDFHWYRLDSNGKWSHKPGSTPATNLDNSGNEIDDPRTADLGNYKFVTFMAVCPDEVTIKK